MPGGYRPDEEPTRLQLVAELIAVPANWKKGKSGPKCDPVAAVLPALRERGGYVDAGLLVLPRLEVGGRFASVTPYAASGTGVTREWTPFANVYLRGHDLKLQSDLTIRSFEVDGQHRIIDRRLRLQLVAYLQ
jgi:hypothetical protein